MQNRLYEEVVAIVGLGENVTEEHLEKLKYLKYVCKESMRLHSVAPTNSRRLTKEVKIEKYIINKGVNFLVKIFH